MENFENIQPSIGGDVADFFGTLGSISTGEDYRDSLNPNGNPFENKSVGDSVKEFLSRYGIEGLSILKDRLNDLQGQAPELFEDTDSPYKTALQCVIDEIDIKNS